MVRGAGKEIIMWIHTRIRRNVSHRYILRIDMQKLKICDMHIQKECVTKYNVEYNTHARAHTHTHTHTTAKHTNTKHSPPVQFLLSPQTVCNPPQF